MYRNFMLVAAVSALFVLGCGDAKKEGSGKVSNSGGAVAVDDGSGVAKTKVVYCGSCGQVKGSDVCCKEGAEVCECGMHEGSPMCCVEVPADMKGKDFCSCGNVKGSAECCKEGAEMCDKCHMIKGSTLCCKIKDDHAGHDHDGDDHDHDHDGDDHDEDDHDEDGDQ